MPYSVKVEYADARKMRTRNKPWYRIAHWPIWIWVFFLAPGPLTFDLFAKGGSVGNLIWLGAVLIRTGLAGSADNSPAPSPRPTSCASPKTAPTRSTAASATPSPGTPCSTSRCSTSPDSPSPWPPVPGT